jgi:PII-like signaling protein
MVEHGILGAGREKNIHRGMNLNLSLPLPVAIYPHFYLEVENEPKYILHV